MVVIIYLVLLLPNDILSYDRFLVSLVAILVIIFSIGISPV